MQLCDRWESSKYGAAQCYELYGGCQGAIGNNCWPNWVWAGTKASVAGKAYDRALESGGWIINEYTPHEFTNAFSVRCVLDLQYLAKNVLQRHMPADDWFTAVRLVREL